MAAAALFVALLAGAVLVAFMSNYRHSVKSTSGSKTVLVAKQLIEQGSSGDVIASKGLFETTKASGSERKSDAITDPSSLRGKQASTDIYPGEQLVRRTSPRPTDSLLTKVSGNERAISVPLDNAHGMIGDVKARRPRGRARRLQRAAGRRGAAAAGPEGDHAERRSS